jgi:hypothetical protein
VTNCIRIAACLSLALAFSLGVRAQESATEPPPNILSMEIDSVKPYQGAPYDKVAEEYPAVSAQFNQKTYYLAMESMTGDSQVTYLSGFDSFAAMQKDTETSQANTAMRAKFSALDAREAPYVNDVRSSLWHFRPDVSKTPEAADLPHSHYWEVIVFRMRRGHGQAFDEMAKMVRDADEKIGLDVHWAAYEAEAGDTDAYLILVPMTSLQQEDTSLAKDKDFMAALGEQGLQRMNQMEEGAVASEEDNIFMVNPQASYVPKSWVDADPKYWGHKPAAKLESKSSPAAKPASKAAPSAKPASVAPAQQ